MVVFKNIQDDKNIGLEVKEFDKGKTILFLIEDDGYKNEFGESTIVAHEMTFEDCKKMMQYINIIIDGK